MARKYTRQEDRTEDCRCPKCGNFLSTFVTGCFNPKLLNLCRRCGSKLAVKDKHIVVIGSTRTTEVMPIFPKAIV